MNLEFEKLNDCPACGQVDIKFDFSKYDDHFNYEFGIFRCSNCGLYFVNPRISKKHILELYDSSYFHGKSWDDKTDYYSNYSNETRLRELEALYCSQYEQMKRFIGRDDLAIVDVGCGLGFFSYFVQTKFPKAKITSLDISPEAVEHLKQKGINAVLGDFLDVSLPNEGFDVVYMREVLEHLYEPYSYVKKVKSLLRKGGLFFYTTGNTDPVDNMKNWGYVRPAGHVNYFNPSSIRALFERAGLKCYPRELLDGSARKLLGYCIRRIVSGPVLLPVGYRRK
jgi:2-polyprenyl-3-methyl-5-hydroxy-6-metoxy-1,4-benzoquinol methylase